MPVDLDDRADIEVCLLERFAHVPGGVSDQADNGEFTERRGDALLVTRLFPTFLTRFQDHFSSSRRSAAVA